MELTIKYRPLTSPLTNPYHLSFGSIEVFHSVLAYVFQDCRLLAVGESTPLPGYSEETQEDILAWCEIFTKQHGRGSEKYFQDIVEKIEREQPGFRKAPVLTALEAALHYTQLFRTEQYTVPIIGLMNSHNPAAIRERAAERYSTYKIKIGSNAEEDANRINFISTVVGEHTQLRLDANQGFTFDEAVKFIQRLDTGKIIFIEQPLKTTCWAEMARLNAMFPDVSFMLDESIRTAADIHKAATLKCCDFIKLKLFKCGSIRRMIEMALTAHHAGLRVILGNGVQQVVGALQEAFVYHQLLSLDVPMTDTELIGPLKLETLPSAVCRRSGAQLTLFPKHILDYEYHRSELL